MPPKKKKGRGGSTPRGTRGRGGTPISTTTTSTAKTPKINNTNSRHDTLRAVAVTVQDFANRPDDPVLQTLPIKLAHALTELSFSDDVFSKTRASATARGAPSIRTIAMNGLTEGKLRNFVNKASKLDNGLVNMVNQLAIKEGIAGSIQETESMMMRDPNYRVWHIAHIDEPQSEKADKYRRFQIIKFVTGNMSRSRDRQTKTFPYIKGGECSFEDLSLYAATLLLVLRDAAMLAPMQEDLRVRTAMRSTSDADDEGRDEGATTWLTGASLDDEEEDDNPPLCREELLCRVAKFVMFNGILVSDLENFDSNHGRRWPHHYEHIFHQSGLALLDGVDSTNGVENEDKNDPFDLNFKYKCISHSFMVLFGGNDCALPFIKRVYDLFKVILKLKDSSKPSARRVGNTLFNHREMFLDRILLWGSDEDTSEDILSSRVASSPLVVTTVSSSSRPSHTRDGDVSEAASPSSDGRCEILFTSPITQGHGKAASSRLDLKAAVESLVANPLDKEKYSQLVVCASNCYPHLHLLAGYQFPNPKSPAAMAAVECLRQASHEQKAEEPDCFSEEEAEFVEQLRQLNKTNKNHPDSGQYFISLIPLAQSADKFYKTGHALSDDLVRSYVNVLPKDVVLAALKSASPARKPTAHVDGHGHGHNLAPMVSNSASPADSSTVQQGLVGTNASPVAPVYTAAGVLGNREVFYFAAPDKDDRRQVGKDLFEPVFSAEVQGIFNGDYQEPNAEDELEQARAGYRMDQHDIKIICFVNHGAMGFVMLAKHLPSGKLVALKFEWFQSWDIEDYVIRVFQSHSLVNGHEGVMSFYDWCVVTVDGKRKGKAVKEKVENNGTLVEHLMLCIAMEWCPGGSFKSAVKERIKAGRLTLDWVLSNGIHLARALGRFKQDEVVHRDLKPANILIGSDGKGKIGDFGLARQFTVNPEAGTLGVGTPGFRNNEGVVRGKYNSHTDVAGFGYTFREVFLNEEEEGSTREKTAAEVAAEEAAKQEAFTLQRMQQVICNGERYKETLQELHAVIQNAIVESDDTRISVEELERRLVGIREAVSKRDN